MSQKLRQIGTLPTGTEGPFAPVSILIQSRIPCLRRSPSKARSLTRTLAVWFKIPVRFQRYASRSSGPSRPSISLSTVFLARPLPFLLLPEKPRLDNAGIIVGAIFGVVGLVTWLSVGITIARDKSIQKKRRKKATNTEALTDEESPNSSAQEKW